jgi:hypothetical protein
MRDPSLHISESNLTRILREIGIPKAAEVAQQLIKKGKLHTLNNRKLTVSTKKMEKKVNRILNSTTADAELFSQLLLHTRRKLKHRGLTQIKQNSREWLIIKDIVSLANEFCETFKLEKREGYIHFINIGISKMNKFMLIKFNPMGNSIIETYSAMLELEDDDSPKKTESMHQFYQSQILSRTGIPIDYSKNPDKYVYFYRCKLLAKELNIDGNTFIKAQFYALEWRNGYPDPVQLVGDKAMNNLNKYLYENNITIGVKKSESNGKIDWEKIKALGDGED